MDIINEEAPSESTCTLAVCSQCKGTMFKEELFMDEPFEGQKIPVYHRRVSGKYMQFLDDKGVSIGPIWPICESCSTEPLYSPEVQEVYLTLTTNT